MVKLKNGNSRYEGYPKCKRKLNTDDIATTDESPSVKHSTITISAYSFDADGNKKTYVDSTASNFPEGITEDKFFAKPILTKEDLAAAVSGGGV